MRGSWGPFTVELINGLQCMEMPTAEHGDVSGSFEQRDSARCARDVREICLVAHIVLSRGA